MCRCRQRNKECGDDEGNANHEGGADFDVGKPSAYAYARRSTIIHTNELYEESSISADQGI